MKKLICLILVGVVGGQIAAASPSEQTASDSPIEMDKVYGDQSHCLVLPEIRNDKDGSISCYCRDALVDVRYVYRTYLITGKDKNLNGAVLSLENYARQMCGKDYDVLAAEKEEWRWSGPEVTRSYPPDSEIERINPDNKGWRTVKYGVRLTYHDAQGQVLRIENFSALERFPPHPKNPFDPQK
jgi:hypothetical protein